MATFDDAARPAWMEIDLGALTHNARELRSHLGEGVRIIAALKGDAYGHGIGPVARVLADCDVYALATGKLDDALAIRAAGVDLPILMFAGPVPGGYAPLLEHGLIPTIHDRPSARAVSAAAKRPVGVYVKVDTGLGRLGVPLVDALEFIREVRRLEHIELAGVYTHLTFHGAGELAWARERYAGFDALLQELEGDGIEVPVTQALASSALVAGIESRANAVCPGSILYGQLPVSEEIALVGAYRPVVRAVKSRLIQVQEHSDPRLPARVGVAPIGLADGLRKLAPGAKASVLLGGRRVPLRGVSLEYIVLDLGDFDSARVGDEVTLLGADGDEHIALEELAGWMGAATHEALMGFEGRLPARYLGGSAR